MERNVRVTLPQAIEIVSTWGVNVVGALVILIAGFVAAGWLARLTSSALGRSRNVDATPHRFLTSIVRYGVIVFMVIAVLERFGVRTTGFVAVLGAGGMAIGFAFRGTLGHIVAGIIVLLFRPFRVGQFIDAAGMPIR